MSGQYQYQPMGLKSTVQIEVKAEGGRVTSLDIEPITNILSVKLEVQERDPDKKQTLELHLADTSGASTPPPR